MRANRAFKKNAAFVIGTILTAMEGILSALSYLMIYNVLTMLLNGTASMAGFMRVTGLLLAIFALRLLVYSIGYSNVQIGGAAVSKRLRLALGDKFKRIGLARFTQGQIGQYVSIMTSDVNGYEKILTHETGNIVKNTVLSLMLILFVCWMYIPAGMILLGSALMLIPNLYMSFRVVKKYGARRNTIAAESVSSIVEYVDGIQTFRAYGVGGVKNRATTEAMRAFSNVSYEYEAKGIPVGFGFNILNWITVPAVMVVGAQPFIKGVLSGADYLMLCMMPVLLTKLQASLSISVFTWKNLMISKRNIQRVFEEPVESGSTSPFTPRSHAISFENVSFSYVQGEPVLKNISFTVPDHKLTAIVGDSGAGKSTILNLIARYYEPESGDIRIGGQSICSIAAQRVLEQISMVDQDVFLFDDTIRENIRHARPDATDAQIEQACREANCDEFIRAMDKGYDTPIGENGHFLSGGERQRLSIARAILKNSPILLLDEATASLDIENELAVKQAIANLLKQKKTVVMIAHTLSIVKHADQILVVAGGGIAQAGTHAELIRQGGKYAAMYAAEQKLIC